MLALIVFCVLAGEDGRFFERRDVDFWGAHRRAEPPADLWSDSTAPPPVKKLLEHPSGETARAYLEWQQERFQRLRTAIAAVEAAQQVRTPAGPLLYFSREGCPWCALEEEELRGLQVVRVPAGSPLWAEFGVTVTPTIVVEGKAFRGFTPREALLKELRRE